LIVRWSLDELPDVLGELGIGRPFLVTSPRWIGLAEVPVAGAWTEVPSDRIEVEAGSDGILAIGGGSAIDTAKAASAASGLRVVSVPTTYSGAEWAPSFGVRTPERRMVGGGAGAHLAGIVYDVRLTLELPQAETVGTALNALAHCAEALYVSGHNPGGDERALAGARTIAAALPDVVESPHARMPRARLLRGACDAGQALALAGLGLAHAMAQALGGTFGLAHGAMNALTLPPALRFNAPVVPEAVARFGDAIGAPDDPAGKVEELGRLGGFERLRDFGVDEADLPAVAEAAAGRAGNRNNPRPATPQEIDELLHSIY
jgi:alcohol dehydrogenase class IV